MSDRRGFGCHSINLQLLSLVFLLELDTMEASSATNGTCRLSQIGSGLPLKTFRSVACGQCFFYSFLWLKYDQSDYKISICPQGTLICPTAAVQEEACSCANSSLIYNLPDFALEEFPMTPLDRLKMRPALPNNFLSLTRLCCIAAVQCCENMSRTFSYFRSANESLTCPATWDGWQCFPETAAGTSLAGVCPIYIYGVSPGQIDPISRHSTKRCLESGQWFAAEGADWTDYRDCLTDDEYLKLMVRVASFGISVITIIPALIIFSVYRALASPMVTIHKHLLISFMLNGVFCFFNSLFFVFPNAPGEHLVAANDVFCILLFSAQLRYFRLTNYLWMLCEGVYLHRLIVAAFSESHSLFTYYILGWGFPLVPTIADSLLRYFHIEEKCWTTPMERSELEWVYMSPCLFSLCINLVLMVSIMYVLIRKLRYQPTPEPVQYRKAVRATVMLLPVFGLHFIFTIYRVQFLAYEILNILLDGLQGFVVAVIICYTNGKVIEALKKTWKDYREKRSLKRESLIRNRLRRPPQRDRNTNNTHL